MAKFYGLIGYGVQKEVSPGIWSDAIVEYPYYGDILKNNHRVQSTNQLNDNINIANEISILADPFAMQNFQLMRYVTYLGSRWKITNIEVEYPRLILSIGGVYNGEIPKPDEEATEPSENV